MAQLESGAAATLGIAAPLNRYLGVSIDMRVCAAIFSITGFLCAAAAAEQRQIDTSQSKMTVRVYKAGVLGAFGHDHEIAAPIKSGAVDTSAHSVELRVAAASLKVRDANTS